MTTESGIETAEGLDEDKKTTRVQEATTESATTEGIFYDDTDDLVSDSTATTAQEQSEGNESTTSSQDVTVEVTTIKNVASGEDSSTAGDVETTTGEEELTTEGTDVEEEFGVVTESVSEDVNVLVTTENAEAGIDVEEEVGVVTESVSEDANVVVTTESAEAGIDIEEEVGVVTESVPEDANVVVTTESASVTEDSQTEASTGKVDEIPATTESTSVESVTGDVTDVTSEKDDESTTENIVEITTGGNVIGDETSPQSIVGTFVDTVSSTISSILGFTDEQSAAGDKVDNVSTTEADVTTEEDLTGGSDIYYDDTSDYEDYEGDAVTIGENSTPSIVTASEDTKIDSTTIGANMDATTENDKETTTSSGTDIETTTSAENEPTATPELGDATDLTTAALDDEITAGDDITTEGQSEGELTTETSDVTTQESYIETTSKGDVSSEGVTTSKGESIEDTTTVPSIQVSTSFSTEGQTEENVAATTALIDQTTTLSETATEQETTTSNIVFEGETCMTEFGIVYQHLENVANVDPCQLCQCVNGSIICAVQDCPLPESPDCIPVEKEENECCPKYACPVDTTTTEESITQPGDATTVEPEILDITEEAATSNVGITEETDKVTSPDGEVTTVKPTIVDNNEVSTTNEVDNSEETDKVNQSTESSTDTVITSLSPSTSEDKTDETPEIPSTTITIDGFVVGMSSTSESGVSVTDQITTEVATDGNEMTITTVSPDKVDETTSGLASDTTSQEAVTSPIESASEDKDDESTDTATTDTIYYDDAGSDDYQAVTDENDKKICVAEDGAVYNHLANVPSNDPCQFCQCANGEVVCATRDCPQPLSDSCRALPIPEGQCCPKYDCSGITEEPTTDGTTDIGITTESEETVTNGNNVSEGTTLQSIIPDSTTIDAIVDSSTLTEDTFTTTGSIGGATEDTVTEDFGIVFPDDDQVASSSPESTETEDITTASTSPEDKDTTEKATEPTNPTNAVTSVEDILLEVSSVSTESSVVAETATDTSTSSSVEGTGEFSTQTNVDLTTAELVTEVTESITSEIDDLTPELGVSPLESGQEGVVTIEATEESIQPSTIPSVGATEATDSTVTESDLTAGVTETTDDETSESYTTETSVSETDKPAATTESIVTETNSSVTEGSAEIEFTSEATESYVDENEVSSEITGLSSTEISAVVTEGSTGTSESTVTVTEGQTESIVTSTDPTIIDGIVGNTESPATETNSPIEVTDGMTVTTVSDTDSAITDGTGGITDSPITDSPALVTDGPTESSTDSGAEVNTDSPTEVNTSSADTDTEENVTDLSTGLGSDTETATDSTPEEGTETVTDATTIEGLGSDIETLSTTNGTQEEGIETVTDATTSEGLGSDTETATDSTPEEGTETVTDATTIEGLGSDIETLSTTDSTPEEETESVTDATTSEEISTDVVEVATVVTEMTEIVTTTPNPVVCLILGGPECQTLTGGNDNKENIDSENGTFVESTEAIVKPEGVCFYDGQFYQDFEDIPSANPCDLCYCNYGEIICATRECLKPLGKENCTALPTLPGECCPTEFNCGTPGIPDIITIQPPSPPSFSLPCMVNGEVYNDGLQVPAQGICDTTCTCSNGTVDCEKLQCHPAPQHLQCTEVYIEGECCPSFECIGDEMPGPEPASHMESTMATDTLVEEIGVATEVIDDTESSTGSSNIETTTLVSTEKPSEDTTTVSGLESTTSYDITATVHGELDADATNFPLVESGTASSATTEQGDSTDPIMSTTEILDDGVDDDYVEPGSCIKDGIVYSDFEDVPDSDPCNLCQCYNGTVVCAKMECPDQYNGCKPVYTEGKCCPTSFDCSSEESSVVPEVNTDNGIIIEGDSSTSSGFESTVSSETDKMTTTSSPITSTIDGETTINTVTTKQPETETEENQTTFSPELTTGTSDAVETSETEAQSVVGTTETEIASATSPTQDLSTSAGETTVLPEVEVTTATSIDTGSTDGVVETEEGSGLPETTTSVNELFSTDSVTEEFIASTEANKDDNLNGGAVVFPTEPSSTDAETESPIATTSQPFGIGSESSTETTEAASEVITSATSISPVGTTFVTTEPETEISSNTDTDSTVETTFAPIDEASAFTEAGTDIPNETTSSAIDEVTVVTTQAPIDNDTESPLEITSATVDEETAITTQATANTDIPAQTTPAQFVEEAVATTDASTEAGTEPDTESPAVTSESSSETDSPTETTSAPFDIETEMSVVEGTEVPAENTSESIEQESEQVFTEETVSVTSETELPSVTTSVPNNVETESSSGSSAAEQNTDSAAAVTTESSGATDSFVETTSASTEGEEEVSTLIEEITDSPATESSTDSKPPNAVTITETSTVNSEATVPSEVATQIDTETDIPVTSSETSATTGTSTAASTGNEQETDLPIVTTEASGTDASSTTSALEVETESPLYTTDSGTGVELTTEAEKNTEPSIATTVATQGVSGGQEMTTSASLGTDVSAGVTEALISTTEENVEEIATTLTPTTKKPMSTDFCLYKGMIIANLADVPSKDPCELCQCVEGKIICAKQECPAPPQENCKVLPVEAGVCCPTYDCSEEVTESSSESDLIKTTVSSAEVQDDDTEDYDSEGGEVEDNDNITDVDALIVSVATTLRPVIPTETTLRPLISSPKPVSTTQLTTLITTTLAEAGYETTVTPAGIPLNEDGTYGTASSALGDYVDYDNIDFGEIGPGACLFEGKIYVSAQQIPRDNPCDFCFCFRGDIICLQQSCPPPIPGCSEEIIPGFCCPRYECPVKMSVHNVTRHIQHMAESPSLASWFGFGGSNVEEEVVQAEVTGCEVEGNFYEAGAIVDVKSGPCLRCK